MNDPHLPKEAPLVDTRQPGLVLLEDDGRPGLWDKPKNVRRLLCVFFATCAFMILLDLLFITHVVHKHASFKQDAAGEQILPQELWFGFYSLYGLGACVALVLLAKQLRKLIMRSEDYYDT